MAKYFFKVGDHGLQLFTTNVVQAGATLAKFTKVDIIKVYPLPHNGEPPRTLLFGPNYETVQIHSGGYTHDTTVSSRTDAEAKAVEKDWQWHRNQEVKRTAWDGQWQRQAY